MSRRTKLICTLSVAAAALAVAGAAASAPTEAAIKRSTPNGKTDVIKAMGNTKWSNIE